MKAMVFDGKDLTLKEIKKPEPKDDEVLIKVHVCGVCRTDLHIIDQELTAPKLPLVMGHQVVGCVEKLGASVSGIKVGERIGAAWLGYSCSVCEACRSDQENLCEQALFTGYSMDGGFAEYMVAKAHYTFPIPDHYSDTKAAPLLCAGLIGYRALRLTHFAKRIGFFGFGASAHILIQAALYKESEVYAFTRPGDEKTQEFAKTLGAKWAGGSDELAPQALDAAIIFAPVGDLIPQALKAVKPGGRVVCAGIHMSEIPAFSYDLLWGERTLRSVANLTRKDGEEFLEIAPKIPIETQVTIYPLEQLPKALADLKKGRFEGAAVIEICKSI